MKWFFDFLSNNSHEVYCWSVSLGICAGCLVFIIIIDQYWTQAYSEGYEQGFKDGYEEIT